MGKKKAAVIIGVVALLAACGGAAYYYRDDIMARFAASDDKVYVEKVGRIMNQYYGVANRYNGVVESQDSYDVNVDSNYVISEVLVEVGDTVEAGQTLVVYDTKEIELQQKQAQLEYEGIQNEINNFRRQIETLKAERDKVEESEKFSYTTEIQSHENSIEQSEFDLESKQLEIDKLKEQIENATVVSKITGIVREINTEGVDDNGNTAPFMKIQETGGFRIKGTIDEQNVWTLTEGQQLIIRSRVDSSQTWNGTITKVDTDNTESSSSNEYYYGGDSGESSTKYPFYVQLDSEEGLLLGQHVYMELDGGQLEEKEGLWLYSYYIVFEDEETDGESILPEETEESGFDLFGLNNAMESTESLTESTETAARTAYVWAANDKNRIEKRYVTLGEYDAALDEYEILSGLTEEDYIAWPLENLYEGVATVTNMEEVDYTSPLYNADTESMYDTETDGDDSDILDGDDAADGLVGPDGIDTSGDFTDRMPDDVLNTDDFVNDGDTDDDVIDDIDSLEDAEGSL